MGVLRRMHQPKLNRRHATERRAPGWTGKLPPFFKEVARSAHRPPTQRAGVPGAMAHDPWGHRFSPACLTSLLSLGRVAAYCLAEAGHDPGKCVWPELIERGG